MSPLLSPYILIMIAAAIICSLIAMYVLVHRRNNSEIIPLVLLMLSITEWIAAALLGLLDQNLAHNLLWAKFEYIGVVSVPLALLVYVLYHSGFSRFLTAGRRIGLALIPATTLLLAWTNDYHGLIWAQYVPYRENGLVLSAKIYGPWFWVHFGYSYLLVLVATVLSIRLALASAKIFRWQVILIGIGILAPWAGNLSYILKINPFNNLDLTPLAFSVSAVMFAIGMYRWRLLDIKPVAHAAVIAGMADGMIILDNQDRIVEVNPATQAILGLKQQELVGRSLEQVFADRLPPGEGAFSPAEGSRWKSEKRIEIKLTRGGEVQDYELSISPFHDKRGDREGSIIFLHDVTGWKRLEERLWEAERKQVTEALRHSEAQLSNAVKIAHLGHWELDVVQGQFTFNDHFYAMLRTTAEQVGGYTMSVAEYARRFVHPDDAALVGIETQKAIETTDPDFTHQLEHRIIYGDGEIGHITVRYFIVKDDQGRTVKTFGVNQDITDRKRAEQELQFRNIILTTQQEVSPDGILVVDDEARILSYNRRFIELLDIPAELIEAGVDGPILQLVMDQMADPGSFLERVQYLYEHKHETSQDELLMSDGRVFDRYSAPMFGADGRYFGRVWYFHDITEDKRRDEALKRSEAHYRLLADHMTDTVWLMDMELSTSYISPSVQKLSGFNLEEYQLLSREQLLKPDSLRTAMEYFMVEMPKVTADPTYSPQGSLELEYFQKDGGGFWSENRFSIIRDEQGKPVSILGEGRDITERKRAEQKIVAALKEKEILLLELYHRTKNNMQVIISMLSLEAGRTHSEELKATCKDIANRIYAMSLVHQKLYQSRDLSQINLQDYLRELAQMLLQNYSLAPQKIALRFEVEPVEVLIDTATPFGLVVTELITNSLKYAFPGEMCGEIRLRLVRTEQQIELHYADNGVGVPHDFDFRRQKTYGLVSIFALVEHQLRGKVSFETGGGLACHICFSDTLYTRRVQA